MAQTRRTRSEEPIGGEDLGIAQRMGTVYRRRGLQQSAGRSSSHTQGSRNSTSLPGDNARQEDTRQMAPQLSENNIAAAEVRGEHPRLHTNSHLDHLRQPLELGRQMLGQNRTEQTPMLWAQTNGDENAPVIHLSEDNSTSFSTDTTTEEERGQLTQRGGGIQVDGENVGAFQASAGDKRLDTQHQTHQPLPLQEGFVFVANRPQKTDGDGTQTSRRQVPGQKKRKETHVEADRFKFFLSSLSSHYKAVASSSIGRMRGVALVYHDSCRLLQHGEDTEGRWVWGRFLVSGKELCVASVYAPNSPEDRIVFWSHLKDSFPPGNWVIAGDWNSIEFQNDSSSRSNQQGTEESLEFQLFCASFALADARHTAFKRLGPRFSRAQWRDGRLVWSRIDRIYASDFIIQKLEHHDVFWASDHIPISASIQWDPQQDRIHSGPRSAYFKADPFVVSENLELLKNKWQNLEIEYSGRDDAEKFLLCWAGIRKQIKTLQYEKAKCLQLLPAKEARLRLLSAKVPANLTVDEQREMGGLLSEVRELQAWQHHKWRLTCRDKFLREGDMCSAYFFKRFKTRRTKTKIERIQTEDGMVLSTQNEIKAEVHHYFSDLAANHFWESGELPATYKEGLLFLIPKGDNPATLREWRPITLLNTIYKLLAKVFALRLSLVLPTVVPVYQQGFIKGRSPQNCILTFALVHEALKRRGKSAVFIALDQEKAYDRLQPDFLWAVMQKLEFSTACINRLRALQENAETRILLNGDLLPTFQVEMGVRQGCPLSPLLYAIASIPFISAIHTENALQRIRPVRLADNVGISVVCLADDTAVYLEIHESSVSNLFKLLEDYQRATGGKVNCRKSKLMIIGRRRSPPDWFENLPLQVIRSDQSIRYLGASLSTLWNGVDNGNLLMSSLDRKAKAFTQDFMSFESRVVALKHGVYSSLIYQLMIAKFKVGTVKKIEGTLRKFLWSTNREGQPKKSLVKWDFVTLPEKLGRLGVFRIQNFQQALICRTIFKAMNNPSQAIWPEIYTTMFLNATPDQFCYRLLYTPVPSQFRLCPVATLLSHAWTAFVSLLRWCPLAGVNNLPTGNIQEAFFLLARGHVGVREAEQFAQEVGVICANHNIDSVQMAVAFLRDLDPMEIGPSQRVFTLISGALRNPSFTHSGQVFNLQDWAIPGGHTLDLTWRGSRIYFLGLPDAELAQLHRINDRWGLSWPLQTWKLVWRVCEYRGLAHRHCYFLWRVLAKSFFVGRRSLTMNLPGHACDFSGLEAEDVSHALFLCPRWSRLWRDLELRLQGWEELSTLRGDSASLPEVMLWALSSPSTERLFKIWMLALIWRTVWLERCTFKFQRKQNGIHLERIVFLFLEEVQARRVRLKKEVAKLYVSKIIHLLPVIPPRFHPMLQDFGLM
ncbi:hypothetical protein R1sor_025504 [Riccia sorocarpa]|uniref:Reverse transcriptase domain-containing protein n=1 Tax=Riccia sorocarpa TaxID=122646 RepID=A0ABD3GAC5_9MARC